MNEKLKRHASAQGAEAANRANRLVDGVNYLVNRKTNEIVVAYVTPIEELISELDRIVELGVLR